MWRLFTDVQKFLQISIVPLASRCRCSPGLVSNWCQLTAPHLLPQIVELGAPHLCNQPRAFSILSSLGAPALAQPVQLASLEVVTQSSSFTALPQYVFLP